MTGFEPSDGSYPPDILDYVDATPSRRPCQGGIHAPPHDDQLVYEWTFSTSIDGGETWSPYADRSFPYCVACIEGQYLDHKRNSKKWRPRIVLSER